MRTEQDTLPLKDKLFRILSSIFVALFLYSCGGGGGGGTSTSSVNALAWIPQGTYHGTGSHFGVGNTGMVAPLTSGAGPAYGNNTGYDSMKVILSSSSITVDYEDWPKETQEFDNWSFAFTDFSSSSVVSDSNTLTSTNYVYQNYDSANGKTKSITVMVPSNYANQFWVYWDNTHSDYANDSRYYYHVNVLGNYTLYSAIPTSGTATYNGGMEGYYGYDDLSSLFTVNGTATFNVNWTAKTIAGGFTGVTITNNSSGAVSNFTNISMASTEIESDVMYSGGTQYAYFNQDLTGSGLSDSYYSDNEIFGYFYGTNADEIAGTWEIATSSNNNGAGYFAAKK